MHSSPGFSEPEPTFDAGVYGRPGSHAVGWLLQDWSDPARDRQVPAKIYFPQSPGPFPVIVFSHGLGGSRAGYHYLGNHWASHGYIAIHVQHRGSDSEVWQQAQRGDFIAEMRAAAQRPENAVNRPQDVRFAIDQLERLEQDQVQLGGRIDRRRIGVGGHSFGAYTALAVAGQTFPGIGGRDVRVGDPRVRAFVAMSPPGPRKKDALDRMYGSIGIPGLHLTGTRDTSPIGITEVQDRRIPFDHIAAADQFLVVYRGGDHMFFAGRERTRANAQDAALLELTEAVTTAFWDAYLKDDAPAQQWLAGDGFSQLLGERGKLEKKLAVKGEPRA